MGERFVIEESLAQWLSWLEKPLPPIPTHADLIRLAELDNRLDDGRTPLAHQRSGARWLLARRGALLADEMGMGKTLTSLLAARAMSRAVGVRVMVIAPLGLHAHWQREASSLNMHISLKSWGSLPPELPSAGTVLLVDEAHFAQSLNAKRTQSLLRLARHPRLRAIWLLTGTPMKNGRPIELYPLLVAMDHPLASDRHAFEEYFCQAHWKNRAGLQVWDCRGASQLNELRRLVGPLILNRSKERILGLPPKIREEHLVTLSASEARGFDHRIRIVVDEYRDRVQKGLVSADAESLAVLTAMRQISAEFKLPAVTKLVKDLFREDQAVVLFSSFVQPLKLLKSYLGGELITGLQSPEERQVSVERFQAGSSNLLLASYLTGGIGFNLHRARHVILLERPWTPGDVAQAEDRCHRLGMDGFLTSHWLQLGLADQLVDSLVSNKAERIQVLLGSRVSNIKKKSWTQILKMCLDHE